MDSKGAFASLLKKSTAELERAKKEGTTAFSRGNLSQVRDATARLEKIQNLVSSLQQLEKQWELLFPVTSPEFLLSSEEPAPQGVSGVRTPRESYRQPILEVLVEMGGAGPTRLVVNRVGEKMAAVLSDFDRQYFKKSHSISWRNSAGFARLEMVQEGLLSASSRDGVWEITPKGREYLQNNQPK